ncbi:hypothetical protein EPUS_01488 [Endocarpon pusillum Z07020]|uniref:Uncharacterized protein n=1 Tax=Endocarpon pusillum (strain Z07020 / HMAS-L-300199) TaxID=1263415 RepID=U1I2H7_ENDPU|nr:uncharacterized protein EPUS_01488 [Endocarpon pusillum Z07020]ERF76154.1 hypothetical protein EPUS_01488 [Endocarpon pusillum Z07020]
MNRIKPFLPFLLTFLVPRGISYYRAIKIAIKTRPPPRPLPAKTSRGLNILFLSICLFFFMSLPSHSPSYQPNIFELTKSRFHIPTDVLFTRLAMVRPLTSSDEALREKITTPIMRQLYLRFGATTLLTCPFCHPTDPNSYLLHHLPTNTLLPHLIHFLLLGLATSTPISGPSTNAFRTKLSLSALTLVILDFYLTTTYSNSIPPSNSPSVPHGIYWTTLTIRPLIICAHDILSSALIYISATNRLPFIFPSTSPTSAHDPEVVKKRQTHLLTQSSVAMQTALTKLRAFGIARSAVVRDAGVNGLKGRDDEYWRAVVGMEGPTRSGADGHGAGNRDVSAGSVWEEEEVMEAVSRVTNGGGLDVEKVRREADIFVESMTQWLEEGVEDG